MTSTLSDSAPSVIVFLDFDGVLHRHFPMPGPDEENARFAFRANFERAMRACPRPVEIVISSTWRRERSLDTLRSLFSPDIAQRIIGVTPFVGPGNGPAGRLVEIEAWLEHNGRIDSPWVAVDDFPELFAPGTPLVVCHDEFLAREEALLIEAVADPVVFAQNHPVADYRSDREKPRIVVPAGFSRPPSP